MDDFCAADLMRTDDDIVRANGNTADRAVAVQSAGYRLRLASICARRLDGSALASTKAGSIAIVN